MSHVDISMGVLCLGGGVIGFSKAKSIPSLVAGIGLGGAYLASAYLITGHAVGLSASLALSGAMGARFLKTRKVMPAGMLAAAGTLAAVYHGVKLPEWLP